MTNPLVISIDSSTTACKAIAWDSSGRAVAEGRAAYPMLRPQAGWAEQNAEHWWNSACAAIRDCVSQVDVDAIDALGITHQRESFVPVDRNGRPIRNAILWLDERSQSQLEWLDEKYGSGALHELTGKPPSMTQALPKIVWLMQNEPVTVAAAAKFLDVHAFLVSRLTGEMRTSIASADPLGLVDMRAGRWATDLIEDLGLRPDQFVETVAPGTIIGHINALSAAATGLRENLPVVAGAGDGQCAGLGANALVEGRAYLNMGTAIAAGVYSDEYVIDRAFRTLCAPLPGAYFFEHILRGGVFTVQWFVEHFATDLENESSVKSAEQLLEAAAEGIPAGADGLMLVPYWNNVMSPYWDPSATGITIGWTGDHGRAHLYRAILEGVAFEQRLVGEAMMAATGQRFTEYVTMGGGSRSDLWCQIMADVTGVPVTRSSTIEVTCLGAGIMAAVAAGWFPNARAGASAMTETASRFEPNSEQMIIYDHLFREVYEPLFPTLQPLLTRLSSLTQRNR
ncbi:MAG: FGGY-family carbohydrate kinase [Caldilineaceae bacterium]